MSRHKRQLALFRTCRRDRKVVTRLYRLAVFVDANETGVQVIPREHEIVGVAAEKGCGELRCEDQPHVLVPPVFVKIVDAAEARAPSSPALRECLPGNMKLSGSPPKKAVEN